MKGINVVVISGNVSSIKVFSKDNGDKIVKFKLYCEDSMNKVNWFNVVAHGPKAEYLESKINQDKFTTGDYVLLQGKLIMFEHSYDYKMDTEIMITGKIIITHKDKEKDSF